MPSAPRTALLMKVHTSNYAISGFTASVGIAELARDRARARRAGGGGSRQRQSGRSRRCGACRRSRRCARRSPPAPISSRSAATSCWAGRRRASSSGGADLIRRLKKNPLKRALRVGKLTLAALEPVLALYRAPELLAERLTTLRLLTRRAAEIESQARRLLPVVQAALGEALRR